MAPPKKTSTDQSERSGSVEDAPHMEALKKLRIIVRAAQRHSNWIEKQCGVTGAQLWVLQELHESPGLRVGDIAARLTIHQTTASNLVDALVKKGYVGKARNQADQRVVTLTLSRKGEEVILRAPTPARGLLPDSLQKLDPKRLRDLNKGLQALIEVIEQADEYYALEPLPFTL